MKENVGILGASPKEDRYANMAQKSLIKHGHKIVLISPNYKEIEGIECQINIPKNLDTLTVYVNPSISQEYTSEILKAQPKRVIFNPASENNELIVKLKFHGIEVEEACTLVLLNTNQF